MGDKQELIKKIADGLFYNQDTVEVIADAIEAEGWLRDPDQVPGRTITESRDRFVFEDATVLAVEFSRDVEGDDGYLQPHPEFPDRHTITAMLKDGDQLPTVGAKDRITVIIEKADPEPSNAEKLEEILIDFECHPAHLIAEHLDKRGVKAGGDDA